MSGIPVVGVAPNALPLADWLTDTPLPWLCATGPQEVDQSRTNWPLTQALKNHRARKQRHIKPDKDRRVTL